MKTDSKGLQVYSADSGVIEVSTHTRNQIIDKLISGLKEDPSKKNLMSAVSCQDDMFIMVHRISSKGEDVTAEDYFSVTDCKVLRHGVIKG